MQILFILPHHESLINKKQIEINIVKLGSLLKFMYSEKATNFCKISTVDLSYVVKVKSTVEILPNFVFSTMQ